MENDKIISIDVLFDQEIYIKGEELYASGSVVEINKIGSGLYNVFLKDGGLIEVELLKPLQAGYKATCECAFFQTNSACKHIVASLLAFQNYKNLKEKKSENRIKRHKTLNINTLLDGVEKEELVSFIKSYASKDKRFLTALKVNFARRVELHDNEVKYKALLDSIIRPVSNESNVARSADIRAFIDVVSDLLDQTQDALSLNQFTESFLITKSCIRKIAYTLFHYEHRKQELIALYATFHESLFELWKSNIAPELKVEIKEFLFELSELSYFTLQHPRWNGIQLIWEMELEAQPSLCMRISSMISRAEDPVHITNCFVALFFIEFEATHTLDSTIPSLHMHLLDKIVDGLMEIGSHEAAISLLEQVSLAASSSTASKLKLLRTLKAVGSPKLSAQASYFYIDSGDIRIIDLMKNHSSIVEFAEFKALTSKVISEIDIPEKTKLNFWFHTELYEQLLTHLEQNHSFSNLAVYDQILYTQFSNRITSLYESMTEQYLSNHVGEHSFDFYEKLLMHLNKIKATRVITRLSLLLETKFAHRQSLEKFHP